MARIDDYNMAADLGRKELKDRNPERIADLSGAVFQRGKEGDAVLALKFLGREVIVHWSDLKLFYADKKEELPIQHQILLLHYLKGANGSGPSGEWIAYQEVPDGKFYLDAFLRRAKNPMVQAFGDQPELLEKLAVAAYGARPFDQGDVSVVLEPLPMISAALILWRGDEEFPPEGNILFNKGVSEMLSAEDIAWLAGMIIYPLIGMARKEDS